MRKLLALGARDHVKMNDLTLSSHLIGQLPTFLRSTWLKYWTHRVKIILAVAVTSLKSNKSKQVSSYFVGSIVSHFINWYLSKLGFTKYSCITDTLCFLATKQINAKLDNRMQYGIIEIKDAYPKTLKIYFYIYCLFETRRQ